MCASCGVRPPLARLHRAQAVTITVNGSGGSLAKSLERIYEKPFTAETGVGVRATAPVSLAKLKAMVDGAALVRAELK